MMFNLNSHPRKDYIELIFIFSFSVLGFLFLSFVSSLEIDDLGIIKKKDSKETISIYKSEAFLNLEIKAKAYVVYDIVNKSIISSKNENEILPLASITKIMTAFSALSLGSDKNISVPKILDKYDLGLKAEQVWSLAELIKYTLVFSSNDGANLIAENLGGEKEFVYKMNTDATLLGLSLFFNDPSGVDEDGKIGGVGSALDVAKLFEILRNRFPEILDITTRSRANLFANTGRIIGIPNTNQDIVNLPGAEASKTGFTDIAGGNLAVIVDVTVGHPVVIVVLGSTQNDRFKDVEALYTALQKSIKK